MNSFTDLQNYKHDIPGRFDSVSTIINEMEDDFLTQAGSHETLLAIHEALIKMVMTSKEVMISSKFEMNLIVLDSVSHAELSTIHIGDLKIKFETTPSSINYYYSTKENEGDLNLNIGKVTAFLPITNIEKRP